MKKTIILFSMLAIANISWSQTTKTDTANNAKPEMQVRQYFFVMLLKGKNRTQDSVTAAKIQAGHMANIGRLYNDGKLKVAGPFGDDGNWLGLFIFDCASKAEVEELLKTDPAVAAGRLAYDIRPWWTAPTGSFAPGKPNKKE